ncbi:MAG TPA: S8 family serine peptidase [Gaiellaceae bacterium]|nr:S8 family serine peptidase [Gaiellaceae bacterium]
MRRLALFVSLLAAVAVTGTASGSLDRTPRSVIEQAMLKVRPAPDVDGFERADNRVRVIVTLEGPPLAAATSARRLPGFGPNVKLNLASSFSRSYLTRLESAQARAIASIRRAIPEAVVSRRYQVLVNGFAVSVPYERLPELLEVEAAERVYPSYSYRLNMNRGPSVLGAPAFGVATGARGDGVKVAVVDDGVDHEHPFLDPAGFSYPAGFPKGAAGSTTPKVIASRGFAGPGASSTPLDRDNSFHGTHVAGVIAGVKTDIEAGRQGICVEAQGGCHPAVDGLEGVAPRAHIGNYRVFNVPAPAPLGGCCSANSPEIVAAFEAAVRDGMDIINFSGGGPQADPRTDVLIEAVSNIVRAGVVPIISAGNDRDFFGLGTAGSPATAPDAISVGAVANGHVFGPAMTVVAPGGLGQMPFSPADSLPPSWISTNQRLVDVGTLGGANRQLCDAALPAGSLRNAIALVSRGGCPYATKSARAREAGATGMVIAENRPGDPGFAIFSLAGGTISDLDGARVRAAAAANGGAVTVRFTRQITEVPTTWAGVPTSFTSSGLTPFGKALKPDVTAPGAQILSSTLPEFAGEQFAVLDGTSFSAPHVAGVAALLTQRHPSWTPQQMKSALMSTAGPAFADTSLTQEASVLLQGAGMPRLSTADKPLIFTDPPSLSFGYLVAGGGASSRAVPVTVSDGGDGAGTWTVEVQAQVASAGATVEAAPVTLAPGGSAVMQIAARVSAGAVQGDNFGFVLLKRGSDVRRIPYAFSVSRSSLTGAPVTPLRTVQTGDTRVGEDRARVYRWPTSPFSILGIFGVDPSVNDDGREKIYSLDIARQAVNAGVVVTRPTLRLDASITAALSSNQPIHPWFLGSLDENDVLGYAGIPVNVNGQLPDFLYSIGTAGGVFLPPGRYYVSVDSGRDLFTGRSLAGRYTLRSWVNDVTPPRVQILTRTLSSGRPTIVAKVSDAKSGVDPLALQLFFGPTQRRSSVGATLWDPVTGIAAFSVPRESLPLEVGPQFMQVVASDFQESKNINTDSDSPLPNTRFAGFRAEAVNRPTVTWVTPEKGKCLAARQKLLVVANNNVQISSVGFFDGNRQIGRVRKNVAGLYEMTWRTTGKRRGAHTLTAVVSDVRGREAEASQTVRICR